MELICRDRRDNLGWQTIPLRFLQGLKLGCSGCAACCQSYAIDELPPAGHRRLSHDLVTGVLPDQLRGAAREVLEVNGHIPFTGRCLFLLDDDGCALHRHYGPTAKPSWCRLFPIRFLKANHELRAHVLDECPEYERVPESPLDCLADSLRLILRQLPAIAELPEDIPLGQNESISPVRYLAREQRARAVLQSIGDPFLAVQTVAGILLDQAVPSAQFSRFWRRCAAVIPSALEQAEAAYRGCLPTGGFIVNELRSVNLLFLSKAHPGPHVVRADDTTLAVEPRWREAIANEVFGLRLLDYPLASVRAGVLLLSVKMKLATVESSLFPTWQARWAAVNRTFRNGYVQDRLHGICADSETV